jgi:hypothetical protein
MRQLWRACAMTSFLGLFSFALPARAEETHTPAPASDRAAKASRPQRSLFYTGAVTLGISYTPALVAGITSTLPEDRLLMAPVAGPWLDLGERRCRDCSNENVNQLLLLTDGVVQGVGALAMVGSFLLGEPGDYGVRPAASRQGQGSFRLRLAPQRVSGGYGLRAIGEF